MRLKILIRLRLKRSGCSLISKLPVPSSCISFWRVQLASCETLQTPDLSPLAQRIMTICRLEPFTAEEVRLYVIFRLQTAGSPNPGNVFTPEALAAIAEESGGVPRLVNSICYRALSSAFASGKRRVNAGIAREAVRGLALSDSGRGWNTSGLGFSLPTDNQEWREARLESREHVHVSGPGDSPFSNRVEPDHPSTAPSSSFVPSSSSFSPPPFSPLPSPATSSTPNKSAQPSASRNEHTVTKNIRLKRDSLLGMRVPEFLRLEISGDETRSTNPGVGCTRSDHLIFVGRLVCVARQNRARHDSRRKY